jgi:hypothetical protein
MSLSPAGRRSTSRTSATLIELVRTGRTRNRGTGQGRPLRDRARQAVKAKTLGQKKYTEAIATTR